ncbi:MAG TPA: hypothetical protein VIG99_33440 [Myxococcaceae bacterium]|jgi:hypothetical protein
MRRRLAIAVGGALVLARCGCAGDEPWGVATVEIDSRAVTRCVQVVARALDGGKSATDPVPAQPGGTLKVAVFSGTLGDDVSVRAEGYTDPGCGNAMDEASPWTPMELQTKAPPGVPLVIRPEGSCSDGNDGDNDGLVDCLDPACASAPECSSVDPGDAGLFPYVPSNFSVDVLPHPDASVLIDCDAGYDTTATNGYFCGRTVPAATAVTMVGGSTAILLPLGPLTITDAGRLTVIGARPLIIAVVGDARIDGPLLAGADLMSPGPGGSRASCLGNGMPGTAGVGGGAGGGGGAYGTAGAPGGLAGSASGVQGPGGAPFGARELVPLLGGCSGGPGGESSFGCVRDGGAGGGALQLSVSGVLQVRSAIAAPGGGGQGGEMAYRCGGGGGGSGGGILLEALRLELSGAARITANGGGGAEGGDNAPSSSQFGQNGRIDGPYPARGGNSLTGAAGGGDGGAGSSPPLGGESYAASTGGAGGGGGSVGRIRINSVQGCALSGAPDLLYSPKPSSNLAGDAGCP